MGKAIARTRATAAAGYSTKFVGRSLAGALDSAHHLARGTETVRERGAPFSPVKSLI
jgi:hypothetical protein